MQDAEAPTFWGRDGARPRNPLPSGTAKAFTGGRIADLNTVVQSAGISANIRTRHTEKLFLQGSPRSDKVRALDRGGVRRAFPFPMNRFCKLALFAAAMSMSPFAALAGPNTVQFNPTAYTVNENAGTVAVNVTAK